MSKTFKRRLWLIPAAAMVSLASCNGDCHRATQDLIEALAMLFLVILIIGICVGLLMLAVAVGGIATTIFNLTHPTLRTKRWGIVFGTINALLGMIAVLSVASVPFQERPEPEPIVRPPEARLDDQGRIIEEAPRPAVEARPASSRGTDWPGLILSFLLSIAWLSLGVGGIFAAVRAKLPEDAPPHALAHAPPPSG